MNKFINTAVSLGMASLLVSTSVIADDSPFSFNGFGTLGMATTDNDTVRFLGADKDVSLDIDSIIGLQISAEITKKFRATLQINGRAGQDFDGLGKAEWAFLSYDVTDSTTVRAGRMRIPFFMISDNLEVGYTYPWVRPPVEVYGQLGFTKFDGIDVLFNAEVGNYGIAVQPFYGETDPKVDFFGETPVLDVTDLWGVNVVISGEYGSIRIGHTEGDFDITGSPTLDFFLPLLPPSVANTLGIENKHGSFTGIGLDLEWNNFVTMAEYTVRSTDGIISDTSGWYTTFGYRFGNIMPHITFSRLKTEDDYGPVPAIASAAAAPPPAGAGDPSLLGFASSLQSDQKSLTLGVRYDPKPGIAIKAEWQRITPEDGPFGANSGLLLMPAGTPLPGFDDHVNVFSFVVDAVF